tara:strand:+ start:11582 stop:11956 length:375 start_codon:yes stop_codon:yes gene_type:complete
MPDMAAFARHIRLHPRHQCVSKRQAEPVVKAAHAAAPVPFHVSEVEREGARIGKRRAERISAGLPERGLVQPFAADPCRVDHVRLHHHLVPHERTARRHKRVCLARHEDEARIRKNFRKCSQVL